LVELHHDGTVVYAVDVSRYALERNVAPKNASELPYLPVECRTVRVGVCEAVALTHEYRLARRIDSGSDLTAVIACDPDDFRATHLQRFPGLVPLLEQHGFYDVPTGARCPQSILPTGSELPQAADRTALTDCAQFLSSGLLNPDPPA
jgi:hypothetical protein